ncbi:MAG: hypothetical protein ABIW81_05685 [Terrimesophilobacter sp.]
MVYVFCAQSQTERKKYHQLDIFQWEFFVLSRTDLAATGLKSLRINRARQLAGGATGWTDLPSAVRGAAIGQVREDDADWWTRKDPAIDVAAEPVEA